MKKILKTSLSLVSLIAMIINPDRYLHKLAKNRGWPIFIDRQRINVYHFIKELKKPGIGTGH